MKTRLLILLMAAAQFAVTAGSPEKGYVAHEWGTFTSIQGSDGGPLAWNPFTQTDLPEFVFNRRNPTRSIIRTEYLQQFANLDLKVGAWLQRMETPVIYFHAQESQEVDVDVEFPKGLITEWFPQVTSFGPINNVGELVPDSTRSHLSWKGVRVFSAEESRNPVALADLPSDKAPSHYYPARNTSANLVETTQPFAQESQIQRDRLLFYRGTGNFSTPLRASAPGNQELQVENTGDASLHGLVALRVRGQKAWFRDFGQLSPGSREKIDFGDSALVGTRDLALANARTAMTQALTSAGLFPDEAQAMVTTWNDAWFQEDGLRVLYVLPQEWTARTLPLKLNPAPRQLVRVMVGRAEVFEPAVEQSVLTQFENWQRGKSTEAIAGLRSLGLGRFLEPALTRAAELKLIVRRQELDLRWDEPALGKMVEEERQRLFGNADQLKAALNREPAGSKIAASEARPVRPVRALRAAL